MNRHTANRFYNSLANVAACHEQTASATRDLADLFLEVFGQELPTTPDVELQERMTQDDKTIDAVITRTAAAIHEPDSMVDEMEEPFAEDEPIPYAVARKPTVSAPPPDITILEFIASHPGGKTMFEIVKHGFPTDEAKATVHKLKKDGQVAIVSGVKRGARWGKVAS